MSSLRHVTLPCVGQRSLKLLVDTGSELSCINRSSLKKGTIHYPAEQCRVSGIGSATHTTVGAVDLEFEIDQSKILHTCQVIPDDFGVPLDGILGLDFLGSVAILDFINLKLVFPQINAFLPLRNTNSLTQTIQVTPSNQEPEPISHLTSAQTNPRFKKTEKMSQDATSKTNPNFKKGHPDHPVAPKSPGNPDNPVIPELALRNPGNPDNPLIPRIIFNPNQKSSPIASSKPNQRQNTNNELKSNQTDEIRKKLPKPPPILTTTNFNFKQKHPTYPIKIYQNQNHPNQSNNLNQNNNSQQNKNFQIIKPLETSDRTALLVRIPARIEKMIRIPTNLSGTCVTTALEISPGVLISSCVTNVTGNMIPVSVLNLNNHEIELTHLDLDQIEIRPLEEFNIFQARYENLPPPYYPSRFKTLCDKVDLEGLNQSEKSVIHKTLADFTDVFHLPGDKLTCTPTLKHHIKLTSDQPIFIKQYRTPFQMKEVLAEQVQELVDDGLVSPTDSPYNFPLLCVPKKSADGTKKYRLVVDFRRLNDITEGDAWPLPNITDILDSVGNAQYWCTYDLKAGFHQIEVAEESRHLLAFQGPGTHLAYNRMPFGLKTAPATMQRLMNIVLSGSSSGGDPKKDLKAFVYMDDIVQFADNLTEMSEKMRSLLTLFRQHNLKIQPEKCQFLRHEIAFLGHHISRGQIKPCEDNVSAIKAFPIPKTPKDIKSFLGMAGYYRRFVDKFAEYGEPLTALTRKNAEFIWTDKCQKSYEYFKNCLMSYPVLRHFQPEKGIILTTDASSYAIGAILSQLDEEQEQDFPVAYASRTLNSAERNYSVFEKELLAIVWALGHFHAYCYMASIVIFTDHKPLVSLKKSQIQGSDRMVRWRLFLGNYNYQVFYKPGKDNLCADALSRFIDRETEEIRIFYLQNGPRPKRKDLRVFLAEEKRDTRRPSSPLALPYHNSPLTTKPISNISSENESESESDSDPEVTAALAFFKNEEAKQPLDWKNHIFKPHIQTIVPVNSKTGTVPKNFCSQQFCCNSSQTHPLLAVTRGQARKEAENLVPSDSEVEPEISEPPEILPAVEPLPQEPLSDKDEQNVGTFQTEPPEYVIDPERQLAIIKEYHDTALGGHQGTKRTHDRLKPLYKWPRMAETIEKYIKTCEKCQKNKALRKTKMPLVITPTASHPFDRVYLDVVGGKGSLPTTTLGNRYILTFQDDLTKFCEAIPIPTQDADTIARAFVSRVILRHGAPKSLLTDQGANFLSNLFKSICKLLKIKKLQTTPFHPQANQVERSHKPLAEYLRSYVNADQDNWDEWVDFAIFTYNTTPHSTTGFTPFELVYGRKAELPSATRKSPQPLYSYDDYMKELKYRLQTSHAIAREKISVRKTQNKKYYDSHTRAYAFNVGDWVLLKKMVRENKLSALYEGPFKIVAINSDVNCTIKRRKKEVRVHFNLLIPFGTREKETEPETESEPDHESDSEKSIED
jgi:transposase InsO family protein